MIRAAAKNHGYAAVVVRPESYDAVLDELRESGGLISMPTRESLAAEAFAYTARYETAIARWFAEKGDDFPSLHVRAYEKVVDLSYGENPHQRAAYYQHVGSRAHLLSMVRQHQGKQLSFNNLLDLDAARNLVGEFEGPACVIMKHNNPCGVALGADGLEAYRRAFACDPESAFGGVIAFNTAVDGELARALVGQFLELVIAPAFDADALETLSGKPNVRVLENGERRRNGADPEERQVMGGMLLQDRDIVLEERAQMSVVTSRHPTEDEWRDLLFAWRVCKHVRSNAIVLAKGGATAGIGAGQMSRVDSVRLAIEKSQLDSLAGAALASDAFFPFPDGPELAIEAGIRAMIQPGGSMRDGVVIEAVERAGVTMVTTARRHFRH
jgi:phosphoribosylaminoimidazolecarboxamide formyltransferase/IMP cyclohydrolase